MPPTPTAGRYEFRVFTPLAQAALLRQVRTELSACLPQDRTEEGGTDTYLCGRDTGQSFKLRRGKILELKCLRGRHGALQLWLPAGQVALPAPGQRINGAFSTWAAMPGFPRDAVLGAAGVLDAFRQAGFRPVRITKHRRLFSSGGVRGEITRLRIGSGDRPRAEAETVAVESADPGGLEALVFRLGLSEWRNESYPEFLAAAAGRSVDPGPAAAQDR